MKTNEFTIATSNVYFDTTSKEHITSHSFDTLCGRRLGFNYDLRKCDDHHNTEIYSKDNLLERTNMCKICLNKLKTMDL